MLACDCDYDDPAWWHEGMGEIAPLATKRSRRCCSCKARIAVGEDCAAIRRWRTAHSDIEERIYGEWGEVSLPTWYLCDRCAGLYESLDGLGFCDLIGQDLIAVCREYGQMQREAGVFRGQMTSARASS